MKDYLESLEIGEEKLKLSSEEIKNILTEHGKAVTTETDKVRRSLNETISNYQNQLKTANDTIQSYKDMDIDSIKKSADDWKTKYEEMEANQKAEKEKSIRDERTNAFFNDIKFASESAKAGVIAQFNAKDFKYDEETNKFLGASEWLKDLKEKDSGAFLSDVANPRFTTTPTAPTNNSSMDEVMKIMGLDEKK